MGKMCVLEPGPPGWKSRPAAYWSAALGESSGPAGPRFPHLESEMITAALQGCCWDQRGGTGSVECPGDPSMLSVSVFVTRMLLYYFTFTFLPPNPASFMLQSIKKLRTSYDVSPFSSLNTPGPVCYTGVLRKGAVRATRGIW